MSELVKALEQQQACPRGLAHALEHKDQTPEEAWADWKFSPDLMWLAATVGVPRNLIVLAACDCAYLTLPFLTLDARFYAAVAHIQRAMLGQVLRQELVELVDALPETPPDGDPVGFATARLTAAKTLLRSVAATTWLEPPELATAAADAAAQTYRAATYKVSADLVRARIPWSEIERRLPRDNP